MSQPNTVDSSPAVHLGQDDGEAFRLGPLEIIVKENGSGTRMNLAVAEFRGDTFRIPPHSHTEHDETIYVLEGRMGVKLGERTFTATAGSSFTIPVNVPHAIWNESGVAGALPQHHRRRALPRLLPRDGRRSDHGPAAARRDREGHGALRASAGEAVRDAHHPVSVRRGKRAIVATFGIRASCPSLQNAVYPSYTPELRTTSRSP